MVKMYDKVPPLAMTVFLSAINKSELESPDV